MALFLGTHIHVTTTPNRLRLRALRRDRRVCRRADEAQAGCVVNARAIPVPQNQRPLVVLGVNVKRPRTVQPAGGMDSTRKEALTDERYDGTPRVVNV